MNIVIASSDLYSKLTIVTIKSLLMNNMAESDIDIYYIDYDVTDANKGRLESLVHEYNRKIFFLQIPASLGGEDVSNRNGKAVISYCYFQDILPENVEKVLLLEGDQIITGSLIELYNQNIDDYYIAAADDLQSKWYRRKIGMRDNSPYVNCGVILYNLKKWREDNITEKITKVLDSNEHMFFYDVQDVINYTVEGGVKVLPPKFNSTTAIFLFDYEDMKRYRHPSTYCSKEEFEKARSNPVIVHFTKNQVIQPRPWVEGCEHPFDKYYLNVRANTVMRDEEAWTYKPDRLNKIANYMYNHVSKTFTAWLLGIVHGFLYPVALYKVLFKTK